MENRKMEIISQLMEELQEMMEPSADDFESRLGREKPKAIEIEMSAEPMEMGEEEDMMMEEESPGDKLKSRLMKLRG